MKVLVLGCGPSGLLAAHAAAQVFGRNAVTVISHNPRKSHINGCQYLHDSIPGVDCGTPEPVRWEVWGDPANYAWKVYGNEAGRSDIHTSVDEYGWQGPHDAWNLRRAYNDLWAQWGRRVLESTYLTFPVLRNIVQDGEGILLNTVPLVVLCQDEQRHYFTAEHVWAIGDAPELGQYSPMRPPPFTVICNSEEAPRWYRAANVFDYVTCEWPHHPRPPMPGLAEVTKPLKTNCNCLELLPVKTFNLGRYGQWQKGVLTHHVYETARKVCEGIAANGVQEAIPL